MTGNELRQKYLDFFADQDHAVIPSASLVPANDPTTLFTGSGMQPMLPYLLGERHPQGNRIVDSQRCFRVQDIEEVGDNRHTTAFEMLGNWSLGDYFKSEQLQWFWTFLTSEVNLDPQKLYVTVFAGDDNVGRDDEAIAIWQDIFNRAGIDSQLVDDASENGMQDGRIFAYPANKNWWSRSGTPDKMPFGEPGGPDSEMFYDFGAELQLHENSEFANDPCHVNCDCGRFLEIGNSVFMQFQKQGDGSFKELPQKNIDFGGGLERILAAKHNTPDVFKTDLFWPIVEQIQSVSGKSYDGHIVAFRIIVDHLKAATWLLSDGVIPSNKAQGYVLRRLIRRAVRFGRELGITEPFTAEVVRSVQAVYGSTYPQASEPFVLEAITEEENKFLTTLDRGLIELGKRLDRKHANTISMVPSEAAKDAFDLYQTFGLPVDIYIDEVIKRTPDVGGLTIEERQEIERLYRHHFGMHQIKSREGSVGMFKGGLGGDSSKEVQYHTATHLLQQALRDVLGETVIQRGSNITPERLRFDFTSENRLTPEQIEQVESMVNDKIQAKLPVTFHILPIDQAEKVGAIHAFGEKYGDTVKVYSIGGSRVEGSDVAELAGEVDYIDPRDQVYSREFCGGPHVANTDLIEGTFKIQKDEKVARDVVRIKAVLE